MNFIKKASDGNFDEGVHLQFQKYSRGEFKDKAIIESKNSGGNYTIKTSAEFSNELVGTVAEILGNAKTKVTGAIISTQDLKKEIAYKEIKQFQGVKKYLIDSEMSGNEIINLLNKFPKNFFALSFGVEETLLKIKAKAPKSGKPGKGEEKPKADFCVLKTRDRKLAEEFVFEKPDFKRADISHDFIIERIEIPNELKNSKDFALVREKSRRVGKIIRKSEIDGKTSERIIEFNA